MEKKAYFYIDDVIWCMRDIARKKPASIFDTPFMAALKKSHEDYGMTVQLNLFYRTDFFYGSDEFTLSEMPDDYKAEWAANADWLRLAFHAKQEFPDYPYVNANYEDVYKDCSTVLNEIRRFAGEQSISYAQVPHWLPISKDGCRALYDCGIRVLKPTWGERYAYNGDPSCLPYGHSFRLLQNRKPETMLYTRDTRAKEVASSLCAYNHITGAQNDEIVFTMQHIKDEETGMAFRRLDGGPWLNLYKYDEVEAAFAPLLGKEYIGYMTHEQYFYEDYFSYQPDFAEKNALAAKILHENGYRFITADEQI